MNEPKKRHALIEALDKTIADFTRLFRVIETGDVIVYPDWTAKQILGHVAFWHESFARNVKDIADGISPRPLKGTYLELNARCFAEIREEPVWQIVERLESAHRLIRNNIMNPNIVSIPYKKGSRDYSPEEHLEIVTEHIAAHSKDVEKALNRS